MRAVKAVRLAWWAALSFLLASLVCVYGYVNSGRNSYWRAWLPNFAAIVRHETTRRLRPRTGRLMGDLRMSVRLFATSVLIDYAATHTESFRPVPRDVLAFFDHWLEDEEAREVCSVAGGTKSLILHAGYELVRDLRLARRLDGDIMEPELLVALDDVAGRGVELDVGVPSLTFSTALDPDEGAEALRHAERSAVERTRALLAVLTRLGGVQLSFHDLDISGTDAMRRNLFNAELRLQRLRRVHDN